MKKNPKKARRGNKKVNPNPTTSEQPSLLDKENNKSNNIHEKKLLIESDKEFETYLRNKYKEYEEALSIATSKESEQNAKITFNIAIIYMMGKHGITNEDINNNILFIQEEEMKDLEKKAVEGANDSNEQPNNNQSTENIKRKGPKPLTDKSQADLSPGPIQQPTEKGTINRDKKYYHRYTTALEIIENLPETEKTVDGIKNRINSNVWKKRKLDQYTEAEQIINDLNHAEEEKKDQLKETRSKTKAKNKLEALDENNRTIENIKKALGSFYAKLNLTENATYKDALSALKKYRPPKQNPKQSGH